ncbi:heterokaryon incompatibility protein-domain-containing protein, partial [Pseudomassariella vexata]
PQHCTTKDNLRTRQKGFKISELPKTFQDAVVVTRELSVQYLWVDSLCILQDSDSDWEQESIRMEQVFASAYCTIAATSAENSDAGFLDKPVNNQAIYVQHQPGQYTYVSANLADFDNDVNEANINRRAWIMQERLLSPRTIHFSRNQIYGEYGKGVYAGENIFLMCERETQHYFKLDPQFPDRLRSSSFDAILKLLQSLIEDYTQCDISVPTDRAVAISGLMLRIGKSLPCSVHHGIIEWYRHRTLLWQRSPGPKTGKTGRIKYTSSKVPSWSWMAFEWPVEFVHDKYGDLDLINGLELSTQNPTAAVEYLMATVWEFADSGMTIEEKSDGVRHELVDTIGSKKGWINIGEEDSLPTVQCVVVVAKRKRVHVDGYLYFVLFVRPFLNQDGYERLGIGMLRKDCGLRQKVKKGYIY